LGVGAVVRGHYHVGDQVLKTSSESKGEVVDGVVWNSGYFVGDGNGAHLGSKMDGVEGGLEGLFACAVFIGPVGLMLVVGAL